MNKIKSNYILLIFLYLISLTSFANNSYTELKADEKWSGTNRSKLNALINHYGKNSYNYNVKNKPVAAFDWDNTMMKNDIGEATLLWMMTHGTLKRPNSFSQVNPWLTKDALNEIEKNCGGTSQFLPTQDKPACADTLLNIYQNQALENGASPWKPSPDPMRLFPPYFYYAQLFSGYTSDEVKKFSQQALEYNLSNPIGATQKIGTKNYSAYVRIYKPMKNLVSVLQQNGFEVWIISASLQPSVEVVAKQVGIEPDHVIGIRQMLNSKGQLTDSFEGCGPYPEGNKDIISHRLGKRCWLNKVVFKISDPQKMLSPVPIIFGAGDSEGDLVFLKDALGGRLVINKNNPELLCNAYQNSDRKWLVNPMFIDPMPARKDAYNCSGFNIPDQVEMKSRDGSVS